MTSVVWKVMLRLSRVMMGNKYGMNIMMNE